ncbi:MAG: hypothetical protein KDJ31_07920, partial [Candidatus Competibacteraceae bacterium]|nr:hypothetical protein [Candidatus Competibacteraceae bacterium]
MRIWIEHSIENNPVAIGIVALSLVVELVIVLLGVYRLLSRKSFPMPVFTICLFIMLSVALNCSAIILVGMFPDPRTSRYIYTLIIISPFFLPFFTVFLERNFLFKIVLSITGVFISISSIIQFDNFKSLKRYS